MGHVILTMAFWVWFVIQMLGFDTVYLCIKSDDSGFSCSRDTSHNRASRFGLVV